MILCIVFLLSQDRCSSCSRLGAQKIDRAAAGLDKSRSPDVPPVQESSTCRGKLAGATARPRQVEESRWAQNRESRTCPGKLTGRRLGLDKSRCPGVHRIGSPGLVRASSQGGGSASTSRGVREYTGSGVPDLSGQAHRVTARPRQAEESGSCLLYTSPSPRDS